MTNPETEIIHPQNRDEVRRAIPRLCAEPCIGGVALSHELGLSMSDIMAILITNPTFNDYPVCAVSDPKEFRNEHDWHLAVQKPTPALRVWQHIRGDATFMVSRAIQGAPTGGSFELEEVVQNSHAHPASFTPQPNDALIFVDFGTLGVTGPSSYYKVDVTSPSERLSIAQDVTFSAKPLE